MALYQLTSLERFRPLPLKQVPLPLTTHASTSSYATGSALTACVFGQVIRNAKLWCDVESVEEAKDLSKQWNWTLVPGFTASKILWLKNNEPENFSKLAKVLLPHDYFNYYLTGRYCMEVHCTCPAMLRNIQLHSAAALLLTVSAVPVCAPCCM